MLRAHGSMSDIGKSCSGAEVESRETAGIAGMGQIQSCYTQILGDGSTGKRQCLRGVQIAISKPEFVDQARTQRIVVRKQEISIRLIGAERRQQLGDPGVCG